VFNGIASIISNPLTSEEKKRLLELINKDDLTLRRLTSSRDLSGGFGRSTWT